jgi:hypothetical protein
MAGVSKDSKDSGVRDGLRRAEGWNNSTVKTRLQGHGGKDRAKETKERPAA